MKRYPSKIDHRTRWVSAERLNPSYGRLKAPLVQVAFSKESPLLRPIDGPASRGRSGSPIAADYFFGRSFE